MSSKRIFSLRLHEDVRNDLLKAAETQSTTVTALINRYILEGLAKDNALFANATLSDSTARVTQPETVTVSAAEERIEELLFQVLLNQRHLIATTDKSQAHLSEMRGEICGPTKV